jgi:CubicO group peptidase (beta-lactamase class C family)
MAWCTSRRLLEELFGGLRCLVIGLAFSILPLCAVAESSSDLPDAIEEILESEKLAGIVWSTVSDGGVVLGSAGYSNVSLKTHMLPSQRVHVGSVTKTVLAMGVLRLVTQGRLSLDSDVEVLLPQLAFSNPWRNSSPITVGNLLEHTAGLDNFRMWQFLNTGPTPDTPLESSFPENDDSLLQVRSEPGTQYSYSNMGYTILGMVIEAVADRRYEDYLDEQLLQPLGMSHSSFQFVTQQGPHADPQLAMGYFEDNVSQSAIAGYLRPAGQFTTTAEDMGKFSLFVLGDGMLGGRSFVNRELIENLGRSMTTDSARAGLGIGHGLALARRDRHGVVGLCHPGETLGFRAYICLFPEQGKSFFYAINADIEGADYEQLNALFIRALDIDETPVEQPVSDNIDLSAWQGIYLLSPNNVAQFEWIDKLFNFWFLDWQDDQITIKSLQSKDRQLIPLGHHLLRATDRALASHVLMENDSGGLMVSDGLYSYQKTSPYILLAYWASLLAGLAALGYIILVTLGRLARGHFIRGRFLLLPFVNILAFLIPAGLYYRQDFLQFGDFTLASGSLAIVSGLLPVSALSVLILDGRSPGNGRDGLALLFLLQWCAVLYYWNMLPLIFWA